MVEDSITNTKTKIIMKLLKLIFVSQFISLFLIENICAQEITNPANYLLSTFSKKEALSSGKEIIELPNPRGPHLVGTTVYRKSELANDATVVNDGEGFKGIKDIKDSTDLTLVQEETSNLVNS